MSDTLQYFHPASQKYTACVDVPFTRQDLEEIISTDHLRVALMVGIAKKHPNDSYERAAGRNYSKTRLEQIIFNLENIEVTRDKRLVYNLYSPDRFMRIKIRTSVRSDKPHVILVTYPNF